MRTISKISMLLIILSVCSVRSFSQDEVDTGYLKSNTVFKEFKVLGVTKTQYARCVESANYDDPKQRVKSAIIGGIGFFDDGADYDLLANDGILTSKSLYPYMNSSLEIGEYRDIKEKTILYDESFNNPKGSESAKIKIRCKLKWVSCKSMPVASQTACQRAGWPSGGIEITECEMVWEW